MAWTMWAHCNDEQTTRRAREREARENEPEWKAFKYWTHKWKFFNKFQIQWKFFPLRSSSFYPQNTNPPLHITRIPDTFSMHIFAKLTRCAIFFSILITLQRLCDAYTETLNIKLPILFLSISQRCRTNDLCFHGIVQFDMLKFSFFFFRLEFPIFSLSNRTLSIAGEIQHASHFFHIQKKLRPSQGCYSIVSIFIYMLTRCSFKTKTSKKHTTFFILCKKYLTLD